MTPAAYPGSAGGGASGKTRHAVLTGASGYVGSAVLDRLLARGWTVTTLGRRPTGRSGVGHVAWSLGDALPATVFGNDTCPVDAVLHLAHQWESAAGEETEENLAGLRTLLDAARAASVPRFVFASTVSARPKALNRYGRLKWTMEQMLDRPGEIAARIGLVFGGPRRGQWGVLNRLVAFSPVLPMIAPSTPVQPIARDALADALVRLAGGGGRHQGVVGLAAPEPVPFGAFLKTLSETRFGRRLRILPVPVGLALAAVRCFNVLPLSLKVSEERIYGLAGLPVVDSAADIHALQVPVEPPDATLSRLFARRRLAAEAVVLLRHTLGARPGLAQIRHYVRGIERSATDRPLPGGVVRRIALLGQAGTPLPPDRALASRLYLAALVAETGPAGADQYYDYRGTRRVHSLLSLAGVGLAETLLLPLRLALGLIRPR